MIFRAVLSLNLAPTMVAGGAAATELSDGANRVLGEPMVTCSEDSVQFDVETRDPFTGQLYVRNEFHNAACRANFEGTRGRSDLRGGTFRLNFNECGMRRQRMATPMKGMSYSITMIVQFHDTFVTLLDKAYHIRCFYREATISVSAHDIQVGELETEMMHLNHPMPKCTYTIRHQGINGPVATFARIGDPIIHVFNCDNDIDAYRILVKDCVVDDGKDHKQQLITSDGCAVDSSLFEAPQYSARHLEAFAEAKVFKWPDESSVYFSCQITLCMKDDDECMHITPPRCDREVPPARHRRLRHRRMAANETAVAESWSGEEGSDVSFDLEVRRLIVLEFDDGIDSSVYSEMARNTVNQQSVGAIHQEIDQSTIASTQPITEQTTTAETTTVTLPSTTSLLPTTSTTTTTTTTTLTTDPPTTTTTTDPPTTTTTVPSTSTTSTAALNTSRSRTNIQPNVDLAANHLDYFDELTPSAAAVMPSTTQPHSRSKEQSMREEYRQSVMKKQQSPKGGGGEGQWAASRGGRRERCFGAEYVVGFGVLLIVLSLTLAAVSLKLLWPCISRQLADNKSAPQVSSFPGFAPYYPSLGAYNACVVSAD